MMGLFHVDIVGLGQILLYDHLYCLALPPPTAASHKSVADLLKVLPPLASGQNELDAPPSKKLLRKGSMTNKEGIVAGMR